MFFGQDQTNSCVGVVSQAYHWRKLEKYLILSDCSCHQCTGTNALSVLITQCQDLWKNFCPTILKYIKKKLPITFFIYSEFLYFASYFNLGGWMVGGGVGFGVSLWSNVYNCPSLIKLVHIISLDIINGINITSSTSTKCTVLSRTQDFLSDKRHWLKAEVQMYNGGS